MTEGKVWEKNGFLVWILVALIVVSLGILIGILAINLSNSGASDVGDEHVFPVSMHTPEFEEINELAAEMSVGDAIKIYENAIIESRTDVDRMEARVEYGRYLLDNGEIDLAMEQFEQVDDEMLNAGYKILYYAALRWYYSLINEEELSEEYNEKIRVVTINSDYAAGG